MNNPSTSWAFYGRRSELAQLRAILDRRRWFFLQISGRRRIGKTTLIHEALGEDELARTLYIQIPDSEIHRDKFTGTGYLLRNRRSIALSALIWFAPPQNSQGQVIY